MTKRMWVSEHALLSSCLPLFTQLSPETGVAVKKQFTGSSKTVNVESLVEFCTLLWKPNFLYDATTSTLQSAQQFHSTFATRFSKRFW